MVGAEPIAFAVARESLDMKPQVNAFIVRKEAKPHGRQKSGGGELTQPKIAGS